MAGPHNYYPQLHGRHKAAAVATENVTFKNLGVTGKSLAYGAALAFEWARSPTVTRRGPKELLGRKGSLRSSILKFELRAGLVAVALSAIAGTDVMALAALEKIVLMNGRVDAN